MNEPEAQKLRTEFQGVETRLDGLEERLDVFETRINERLDQSEKQRDERFDKIETRLDSIDKSLKKLDEDIRGNGKDGLNVRIARLETIKNWVVWIIPLTIVPLITAVLGAFVAHYFELLGK